jgi:hypothetical protein
VNDKYTVKNVLKSYLDARLGGVAREILGNDIIDAVRLAMWVRNKSPRDGTIMRELRKLRTEGYFIRCIDTRKSIYYIFKWDKLNL